MPTQLDEILTLCHIASDSGCCFWFVLFLFFKKILMPPKPSYASETTWELSDRFLRYLAPGDSKSLEWMSVGPGQLDCQRASQVALICSQHREGLTT